MAAGSVEPLVGSARKMHRLQEGALKLQITCLRLARRSGMLV